MSGAITHRPHSSSSLQLAWVIRHGPYSSDPRVRKETEALAEAPNLDVAVLCRGESSGTSNGVLVRSMARTAPSENPLILALQAAGFALWLFWRMWTARPRPDLVIVHSIPSWLVFPFVVFRRLTRRDFRLLLDHHEPEAEMLLEAGLPRALAGAYRRLETSALKHVDGVIDVSPEMATRSKAMGARRQIVVDNTPGLDASAGKRSESTWDVAVFGSLIQRYDLDALRQALDMSPTPVSVLQIGRGESRLRSNPTGGEFEDLEYIPQAELQRLLVRSRFGFVGLAPSSFTALVSPNRLWELVTLEIPAIVAKTPLMEGLMGDCAIYYAGGDPRSLCDAIQAAVALSGEERAALASGARRRLVARLWPEQSKTFLRFCLDGEPSDV